MGRAIWGILIALVLFTGCNGSDQDLNHEAKELINLVESTEESEAFLYLLGMEAPEGVDPTEFGRNRLEETELAPMSASANAGERITAPKSPLLCNVSEFSCRKTLFTTDFDSEKIRLQNKTLLTRVEEFHRYDEFRTLTDPSNYDVYPKHSFLTAAARIEILSAISAYRDGRIEEAVDTLSKQIEINRRAMSHQDSLIGKMVYVWVLSEIVNVVSIILSNSPIQEDIYFPKLSREEKDFFEIAARELVITRNNYQLASQASDDGVDIVVNWFLRYFLKPNMSTNMAATQFTKGAKLAQLSHEEFANPQNNMDAVFNNRLPFENKIGNFLAEHHTDLKPNIARLYDLDAKLELFNHRYAEKREFSTAKNPYYPDEPLAIFHDRVCFRGPIELGSDQGKCLITQISNSHDE